MHPRVTIMIGLLVALGLSTAAAQRVFFIPTPYTYSWALDVNARGDVLGFSYNAEGRIEYFVYTHKHRMQRLDSPTGSVFAPSGFNNRGDMVGQLRSLSGDERSHGAVRWRNGSIEIIDAPDVLFTIPQDISSDGTVVGYTFTEDAQQFGFKYSRGTFSPIDAEWDFDDPTSIADDGTIVGSTCGEYHCRGFIVRDDVVTSLAVPGAITTVIGGVAPNGVIVGYAGWNDIPDVDSDPDRFSAFVYRKGRFELLGPGIAPRAVNAAGTVVGSVEGPRAFVAPALAKRRSAAASKSRDVR